MNDEIDDVAKAIFRTHHEATLISWDELSEQAKEEFLTQARAAIASIEMLRKSKDEANEPGYTQYTAFRP